jgi:pilus assembly protein CpaE
MSEAEYQATDILLPSARVFIFSNDKETLSAGEDMVSDWRFARVDVETHEGNVSTAVETFKVQTSPDLLIIQTDDINDDFIASLRDLSAYCEEDTSAIIIGPVNDVYLYRKLIEMGVSDYLVRPIKSEVLRQVIAKALIDNLGVSDSRLISFIGAKGGVGTSTLAQIAAWNAAKTLGLKTLLMDASGGWSSLSVGAGFDPSATLHEVAGAVEAGNEDALARMFYEASDKLRILSSGADAMLDSGVSAAQYEAILDNLMVKSPLVFVDLSAAEPALKKAVISRSHHSIVVTSPSITSLRFCRSLIKELSDLRGGQIDDISLVLNMQGMSKAYEVDRAAIAEALDIKPSVALDYIPSLFMKYESDVEKILSDKDGEALSKIFLPLLKKVISIDGVEESKVKEGSTGFLGGFLSKIGSK